MIAFDILADRRVVHGKVAMAKLYASEMAGRVADRAVQIFGGRGYMHDTAAARFYRELRVDRIWEGTSEIQRLIIARGLEKRGPSRISAGSRASPLGQRLSEPGRARCTGPTSASGDDR